MATPDNSGGILHLYVYGIPSTITPTVNFPERYTSSYDNSLQCWYFYYNAIKYGGATVTISAPGYNSTSFSFSYDGGTFNITLTKVLTPFITILVDENNKPIMFDNQPVAVITLPDEYTELAYIASTGTQYIDTNIIPTSDDLIYEWEGRDDDPSGNTSLFSSEYAVGGVYSNRDFGGVIHGNNTRRNIYVGKTTGMNIGYASTDGLFHRWILTINSNYKVYLTKDSIKLTEYTWTGSINRYNSIALFCNHTTNSFSQNASVAYKYFKIIDNSKVVFWGIPAKRNSDDVLGMYDLVTETFFVNKGTGTFVAGPDIN